MSQIRLGIFRSFLLQIFYLNYKSYKGNLNEIQTKLTFLNIDWKSEYNRVKQRIQYRPKCFASFKIEARGTGGNPMHFFFFNVATGSVRNIAWQNSHKLKENLQTYKTDEWLQNILSFMKWDFYCYAWSISSLEPSLQYFNVRWIDLKNLLATVRCIHCYQ